MNLHWIFGDAVRGLSELRFLFDNPLGTWTSFMVLGLVALLVALLYPRRLHDANPRVRRIVTGLRAAALVLALLLVLKPALQGFRFDPSENYVLMLFDNSASMAIAPQGGESRGDHLKRTYAAELASFEEPLSERFQLARYGFGEGIQRIHGPDELGFTSPESALQAAVKTALGDFQGIPVNAVIVFSDGVELPSDGKILLDREVPVFTVAVGASMSFSDFELGPLSYAQAQGDQAPIRILATFHATGFAGHKAVVEVLDGDTVVATETVAIESDDVQHQIRLEVTPRIQGWTTYEVRVRKADIATAGPRDEVAQNNSASLLVDNREKHYKIFYFSGRPNWENKFIQQALRKDKSLELTSVLRISAAETKFVYRGKNSTLANPLFEGYVSDDLDQPRYDEAVFLRFGHDRSLAGKGFPESDLEIFSHQVLVIGEVEANFFSQEQFDLMREFVSKRGGVLLMMGGPHSFSEGGFQNTILAGFLPVLLERKVERGGPAAVSEFAVAPTMEGLLNGAWALHPSSDRNSQLWQELPPLKGLNSFAVVRPQATTLAKTKSEEAVADDQALFAIQRYGEGKTAVFATSSTWQWHMSTDKKDERHGTFWRQLMRGLARDVPGPIALRGKQDTYIVDREALLEVNIRDQHFEERGGLETRLVLTDPLGTGVTPGVEESLNEVGIYRINFTPQRVGIWKLSLSALDADGQVVGTFDDALLVSEDRREYQHARANPQFLQQLADATGGKAFDLKDIDQIPDQIPYTRRDQAESVIVPLWHWPPLFVLLVAVVCSEWFLRRKWGHA